MNRLCADEVGFTLDGERFQIISGAIHYFRVPAEYWEDRLTKLRACGFNTVETYCCWNLHEKQEGVFNFEGMLDLRRFLNTAAGLGLRAIVRPGPYICAEWEYGGLPYWLNRYPLRLRCADGLFLAKTEAYIARLAEELRPCLAANGGCVIALQVENEYGSYGNDRAYLHALAALYQKHGLDSFYFTSDGPEPHMLTCGTAPEYTPTCNFGSHTGQAHESFRRYFPRGPFMVTEFWNGWFDHWGEVHHSRDAESVVEELEAMLDLGASVNFYMFHGGTNFGFTSGANHTERYEPTVTSYDYDAPLSEAGDMTEKYHAVKAALERRFGPAPALGAADSEKAAYGRVALPQKAGLFANLARLAAPVRAPAPLSMEELGLAGGFVLYSAATRGDHTEAPLLLDGMRDRALVYVDGQPRGVKEACMDRDDDVILTVTEARPARLDILVENMGRTNYGPRMGERKGIAGGVRLGQVWQFGWEMWPLALEDLSALDYAGPGAAPGTPVFLTGTLSVDEPKDTFVRLDGFTKGVLFVNGHNLGRYWNEKGPQRALYLPAPFLKRGENTLTVFELERYGEAAVTLTDRPDLG